MICRHHNVDPCPTCSTDGYIPKPYDVALREDVEYHGAWFWYNHASFWMEKFFEANRETEKWRDKYQAAKRSNARMLQMFDNQGGRL